MKTVDIVFKNTDGRIDETEFDVMSSNNLKDLWWNFCKEEGIIIDIIESECVPEISIAEMKEFLLDAIHESTQTLELISDLELLSMDAYYDIVDVAKKNIRAASDKQIAAWYKEIKG